MVPTQFWGCWQSIFLLLRFSSKSVPLHFYFECWNITLSFLFHSMKELLLRVIFRWLLKCPWLSKFQKLTRLKSCNQLLSFRRSDQMSRKTFHHHLIFSSIQIFYKLENLNYSYLWMFFWCCSVDNSWCFQILKNNLISC